MTDDNRLHAQINRETTLDQISSASIRHFSQITCDTDIKPTCYLHTVCFHVSLRKIFCIKILQTSFCFIMLKILSIVQEVNFKTPPTKTKTIIKFACEYIFLSMSI